MVSLRLKCCPLGTEQVMAARIVLVAETDRRNKTQYTYRGMGRKNARRRKEEGGNQRIVIVQRQGRTELQDK